MWIAAPPSFSSRERIIFGAWLSRCDEVHREEGQLDFYGDAVPILVAIVHEHRPKIAQRSRRKILDKLTEFLIQSEETLHAEPAGRA